MKVATGEYLETGTWAPDGFTWLLRMPEPAQGAKPTLPGLMAAVFNKFPRYEVK